MEIETIVDDPQTEKDDITETKICSYCDSLEIQNQCDQCNGYFCSNCEIEFNGESVLGFFSE